MTVSPLFFPDKTGDLFWSSLSLLFISLGCHPPVEGVTPHLFLPVRPRLSTILCKFSHNFFLVRVSPPEGVTQGGPSPPPLVTPLHVPSKRDMQLIGRLRSTNTYLTVYIDAGCFNKKLSYRRGSARRRSLRRSRSNKSLMLVPIDRHVATRGGRGNCLPQKCLVPRSSTYIHATRIINCVSQHVYYCIINSRNDLFFESLSLTV